MLKKVKLNVFNNTGKNILNKFIKCSINVDKFFNNMKTAITI